MNFEGHYLTYDEYCKLGGALEQTPFDLLEFEARRRIDKRTQGRLKNVTQIPQEVKLCIYALIKVMTVEDSDFHDITNNNIASESVGSYSVTYVTGMQIQETIKAKNVEIDNIITSYLTGVVVDNQHILFLGVC